MTYPSLLDRIEKLGRARDGLLVSVAVVYMLGFVSWAIHSVRNNLGFIRILDIQYLLGGLLPAFSVLVIIVGWHIARSVSARRVVVIGFGVAYLAMGSAPAIVHWLGLDIVSPLFTGRYSIEWPFAPTLLAYPFIVLSYYVSGLVLAPFAAALLRKLYDQHRPAAVAREERWRIRRALERVLGEKLVFGAVYGWILSLAVASFTGTIALYFFVIYPALPQSLGGPRPRCAILAVDATNLPTSFLETVDFDVPRANDEKDRLTIHVRVLFSDDRSMLVTGERPLWGPDFDVTSWELPKEIVKSVAWCSDFRRQ